MLDFSLIQSLIDYIHKCLLTHDPYRPRPKLINNNIESVCPFCLGSANKKHKKQFYLNIAYPPYVYHCFRCERKGILPRLITELQMIYNIPFEFQIPNNIKLDNITKQNIESLSLRLQKFNKLKEILSRPGRMLKGSLEYKYFLKRLFAGLTENEIQELLTDTNIKSTFKQITKNLILTNEIEELLNTKLETPVIGFTTFRGYTLQFRYISNNKTQRYSIAKLIDKPDIILYTYYNNQTNNYNRISVIIAEGFFSLVSGFMKLMVLKQNGLYTDILLGDKTYLTCSFGKSNYAKTLEHLYKFTSIIDDTKQIFSVVVLSDSDVKKDELSRKLNNKNIQHLKILYPPKNFNDWADNWNPIEYTLEKTCIVGG